ncbi:MAG: hypothetical protein IT178_14235 [Acidobacteria bacterium]|nr:hypothetical protein [Acidobacteriota bacterium]
MTAAGVRAGTLVAAYLMAAGATLALARGVGGADQGTGVALAAVSGGLVLPLALARWPFARVLQTAFALLFLGAVVVWTGGRLPAYPYGDGAALVEYVETGFHFPRWLLGMAAVIPLFDLVWRPLGLMGVLGAAHAPTRAFVSLMCLTTMGIGSVAMLQRFRGRLSVAFGMLMPIWVLLSSGYVEYYPLIMGAHLAALAWTFEKPLEERSIAAVALVTGLLPALYIASAPVALLMLAAACLATPRRTPMLVGASAAAFVVAVGLAFPGGPLAYLDALGTSMNAGDTNTMFRRYAGETMSATSIFFAPSAAVSSAHLGDVLYLIFWCGGWLWLPLGLAALLHVRRADWQSARLDAQAWLGVALVAWQVFYVLFMVPKLGPTGDLDLFAVSFMTLAFLVGEGFDRLASADVRVTVLAAALGACVATAPFLLGIWVPVRT